MKSSLIAILVVAVVSVALVAAAYGLGVFGTNSPSVAITGVYPANHSVIPDNRPTVGMNLTLQNVKIDSLNFILFIDGNNATGGNTLSSYGVQLTLPNELAEGTHEARANVSLDQKTLASSTWEFSVDTSPPELVGLSPGNGTNHAGDGLVVSANFTDLTGTDLGQLKLLLDGIDITNSSQRSNNGVSYAPPTTLSEGVHNFTLELCDAIGNEASYSWSLTIKYPVEDSFPPYIIACYPANNSMVNASTPLVWFHINDTLSGVNVGSSMLKIDNIAVPFNYSGSDLVGWALSCSKYLTDNNHTAWVYAVDNNNNSMTAQINFTVDSTPPSVGAITPSNGSALTSSSVTISAHFMDLISGVDPSSVVLIVDFYRPITAVINSSGFSYSAQLSNGTHSISLRVSDLAGNAARVNWAFTVNIPSNNTKPEESVIVLTKTGYKTQSGLPTIVGEVKNNGTTSVKNVYIKGLFMCSDGKVINNDKKDPAIIYGYAEIGVLEPGYVSPFKLEMPADFPDYVYIISVLTKFDAQIISFTTTTDVPYKDYTFSNATGVRFGNQYNLTGAVTNTGNSTIVDLKVVGTFYMDTIGTKPIAVESTHVLSLSPGETAYFTIVVDDGAIVSKIVSYDLKGNA